MLHVMLLFSCFLKVRYSRYLSYPSYLRSYGFYFCACISLFHNWFSFFSLLHPLVSSSIDGIPKPVLWYNAESNLDWKNNYSFVFKLTSYFGCRLALCMKNHIVQRKRCLVYIIKIFNNKVIFTPINILKLGYLLPK